MNKWPHRKAYMQSFNEKPYNLLFHSTFPCTWWHREPFAWRCKAAIKSLQRMNYNVEFISADLPEGCTGCRHARFSVEQQRKRRFSILTKRKWSKCRREENFKRTDLVPCTHDHCLSWMPMTLHRCSTCTSSLDLWSGAARTNQIAQNMPKQTDPSRAGIEGQNFDDEAHRILVTQRYGHLSLDVAFHCALHVLAESCVPANG